MRARGRLILDNFDLRIEAGSHVAVVGTLGAGKSSFVGSLLGWHRAADGRMTVDDEELKTERLARLRRETAWVETAIQLWNRLCVASIIGELSVDQDDNGYRPTKNSLYTGRANEAGIQQEASASRS